MNKENTMLLTAVIIVKNEEARIEKCMASLAFADEILVIDNGSTDNTETLAKKKGARVIKEEGNDFSRLRNKGLKEAKGEWILYIDADEVVTEELKKEIIQIIRQKTMNMRQQTSIADCPMSHEFYAYFLRRRNFYLGTEWPKQDMMQRLFKRSFLISWHGKVHETADVKGEMGILKHPLIHVTHRTLEEMVAKTNEWSVIEAKLRFDMHHPSVVGWRLIRVMITGFFRSFIKEDGWKAGTVGWIESIFQSFSMFITYAKLWEMQQKRKIND